MNVHLDCFPCFMRQAVIALRLAGADGPMAEKVLKAILPDIERTDMSKSPAHATTFIHRTIRQVLGADPFQKVKSEYNLAALLLSGRLERTVEESSDPLLAAARIAVAGNIIDFGIFSSVDIEGTLERALSEPFAIDDYADFKGAVEAAEDVLYLFDNAGEIVFDKPLIKLLASTGKRVTGVVKGQAVLNDATVMDAVEAGVTEICEVTDNGSDCIGTILYMTPPRFNEMFEKAGLVISKGQGNFETLMHEDKRMFFLFQSKCGVVADFLGVPLKAMVLKRA